MIRFDLPDDATDAQIEAFLATLNARARDRVRELLLDGAGEEEILEYIQDVDRLVAQEEASGYEEEEEPAPVI